MKVVETNEVLPSGYVWSATRIGSGLRLRGEVLLRNAESILGFAQGFESRPRRLSQRTLVKEQAGGAARAPAIPKTKVSSG